MWKQLLRRPDRLTQKLNRSTALELLVLAGFVAASSWLVR
jgi:hypothetical protein